MIRSQIETCYGHRHCKLLIGLKENQGTIMEIVNNGNV